jgi:hypothetical protein
MVLNHSEHLRVDQLKVSSEFILKVYGIEAPEFKGAQVGLHWVTQISDTIYWDGRSLALCEGDLIGVWSHSDSELWAVACSQELVLFTRENELLESIGKNFGLPMPIVALGQCGGYLCLQSQKKYLVDGREVEQNLDTYRVDIESLEWLSSSASAFNPLPLTVLPPKDQRRYRDLFTGRKLTWERVVLDIHAARFLGALGPWVLDAFVLMFLFLSGSGFYLWYTAKNNK